MSSDTSAFGSKGESSKQVKKGQKAKDMRQQLDVGQPRGTPTPGQIGDSTHLLIVNGGGADAFLGDFFGLVRFFERMERPDFGGEFWTCDNPMDHFKSGQHTDIKFGGDSVVLKKYEVVLDKFANRPKNWQYIAPVELLDRVFAWLDKKCDKKDKDCVKEGDSVIIIFLAHGHGSAITKMPDGCVLGDRTLYVDAFVERLRKFPKSIQVNVISNSCYSGLFADKVRVDGQKDRWIQAAAKSEEKAWPSPRSNSNRFRNGLFVAGLVRSLGGLQTAKDSPSLKTVRKDLDEATQSHPQEEKRSTPTDYLTRDVETKVASLLFRRFADFPMMQENSAAMRRNELDQSYLTRYPTPSSPPPGQPFCVGIIREESEAFGLDNTPNYSESNFVAATLQLSEFDIPDILRSLLWRGRQQSNVFQTFMTLCLHGFCDLSALKQPVDFDTVTPTSSWMHNALMSYSAFAPLYERGSKMVPLENKRLEWQDFSYPLTWLETMLVRSAASIGDTFDAMTASGFLGTINKAHFDQLPELDQEWAPDPDALVPRQPMSVPCFGLMLPSGIDTSNEKIDAESIQQEFYGRFNKIEEAFEKYFLIPVNERFSLAYQTDREFDLRDWQPEAPLTPDAER